MHRKLLQKTKQNKKPNTKKQQLENQIDLQMSNTIIIFILWSVCEKDTSVQFKNKYFLFFVNPNVKCIGSKYVNV